MGRTVGIILAGGIGSRFCGDKPKQYCLLNGKEIISYSINAFKASKRIDNFIVVVDRDEYLSKNVENHYSVETVLGGSTRNKSLQKALSYIEKHYPDCEKVVENNAACPMVTPDVLDLLIDYLDVYDFAQCAYKITDALGSFKHRNVNRNDFFLIQSPDAYRFQTLIKYFDSDSEIGHPAAQMPEEVRGINYFDFHPNIKITYPEDLRIAELFLSQKRN